MTNISYTFSGFTFLNTLTFGVTVRLSWNKTIFYLILFSNIKTNEVAQRGGGAGGEREARCQRAPQPAASKIPSACWGGAGGSKDGAAILSLNSFHRLNVLRFL